MSKHKYQAIDVKSVDWTILRKHTQGQSLVFAVDVAKKEMFGALMTEKKEVVVTIKWIHPTDTCLVINHLVHELKSRRLVMAIEPSGTYGDPLLYRFEQAGIAVYRVSPKKTSDAKELYDGVPSLHDAKSAYIIGRLHLEGNSSRWPSNSPQRRTLQALLGLFDTYQSSYQRNLNRLEARLARHWPEVLPLLTLDSVTLESLLVEYGSPEAVSHDREGSLALMQRAGRGGLSATKQVQVLSSAVQTLGVPCIEAERDTLQGLARELHRLRLLVKQARQSLEQAGTEEPGIAAMSQVVGKLTATILVATQGSPVEYASAASYVKGLGLNLKEKSSGQYKSRLRLTKRGPGLARKYLYFATMRLLKQDPVVRAWYEKKVHRDGGMKMKALIAVMRKLVKALWYVGQGEAFDSSRLFNRRALDLDHAVAPSRLAA